MPITKQQQQSDYGVLKSSRSIKGFILKISIFFSALGFVLIFLAANNAYRDSVKYSTIEASRQIATTTFDAIFRLKQKSGASHDVENFLYAQQQSNSTYKLKIYRSDTVATGSGHRIATTADKQIQRTIRLALPQQDYSASHLRYSWPLKADSGCINCHQNSRPGDILGVIEVNHNASELLTKSEHSLAINLIYLSPLPLFLALFVIAYLNRRINRSVEDLEHNIDKVNSVSDLSDFNLQGMYQGFSELNRIYTKVDSLSYKMRHMAVDKDLLEFEIQLLERFVITSEVVRDWREYISVLLTEINEVMPVYNLFSIFKVDDEMFALEIFWLGPPSPATKRWMDAEIRKTLLEHPLLNDQISLEVLHHTAESNGPVIELNVRCMG